MVLKIKRVALPPDEIPRKWYNILPDLPDPLEPYKENHGNKTTRELPQTYTRTASKLEFSDDKWIKIPDVIVKAYLHCLRPTHLIRAHRLEAFLKTPARIYYKCESLPPVGTFKVNTALPQAYWARKEGYSRTIFPGSTAMRTNKYVYPLGSSLHTLNCTQTKKCVHLWLYYNFGRQETGLILRISGGNG